jgi:hypothetical protein
MGNQYAGLDVGEHRLFAAVIDTDMEPASISFSPDTEPALVLDWCTRKSPQSVAIDSPPAHSKGLAKIGNRRVAEERLGIGGCYGTPRLGSPLPPWMAMGMRCHSRIGAAMSESALNLAGTGQVFEVHPTYAFRSLLGVVDDGERVRCDPERLLRPKAPRGSIGHIQRVRILRLLLEDLDVVLAPPLSEKVLSSLDWTDAAMSAVLAVLRDRGATQGVGDATEGTIIIADPSKLGTLVHNVREAVSSVSASAPVRPAPTTRKRIVEDRADCALLRLGGSGIGTLSQEDTLSALRGQHLEEQIILPVGVRAIARDWVKKAASEGFWLLVAHKHVRLAVRVVEVIGSGRTQLTAKDSVLSANRDPWPAVEQSEYWLRCDELLDDLDLPATAVSTRQGGTWTPGLPRNQTAWLAARIDDEGLCERLREPDASNLSARATQLR